MAPQASISFAGLSGIRGFSFSFSRGVTPSVCTVYCLPQAEMNLPPGTLTLSYNGNGIAFPGCAVKTTFIRKPADKLWPIQSVQIMDRRWQWAGKVISGDYNRRASDGTVDNATRKSPAELAALLLTELGESGFDTSMMPGGVFPKAVWASSRADLALQALCDYVACEVILNHQTDKVEIWPLGVGGTTPTNAGEIRPKYRFVPRTNVPEVIEVRCGSSVWQTRLKLRPVAFNYSNGQQKLINDLEWKPQYGWSEESPFAFPNISNTTARALAFEEIWKDYRIVGQEDGTIQPPFCQLPITSVDQYTLNDYTLEAETDLDGYKRRLPPYIYGTYWGYTDHPDSVTTNFYVGPFRVDKDRRLVHFQYPVFALTSAGYYSEPTLSLSISYRLRATNGEEIGLLRYGQAGGSGRLVLKRPEIFSTYSTSTFPGVTPNTESQAVTEADRYVRIFQQKFANPNASEIEYPGLVMTGSLDGVAAQITWKALPSQSICSTTVCEGEELDISAISRSERRRREKLEAI